VYEAGATEEAAIPVDRVVRRASRRILDEFAIFFEWTRNSLQNVLLDINKCRAQRNVMDSDEFWARFLMVVTKAAKVENLLWDFKETLPLWHAKGTGRNDAQVATAEDIASFANASGGVLIVGVSDARVVVGAGEDRDLEDRLKTLSDVLARRLDCPRACFRIRQVPLRDELGKALICLVIVTAMTAEPVGVALGDANGGYSYPVRRESGITREPRRTIAGSKAHLKSDSFEFLQELRQYVRENQ